MKQRVMLTLTISLAALCIAWASGRANPAVDSAAHGRLASSSAGQVEAPDVIRMSASAGPPAWASAQAVMGPDGGLNWQVLGAAEDSPLRAEVRRQAVSSPRSASGAGVAEVPERECPSHTVDSSFTAAEDPPADTLDDLAANAKGVYAGVITAVTPGFSLHSPYSLLTLTIQETLRAAGQDAVPGNIFILHPVAHFRVGSYVFCGAPSGPFGDPKVGDQVVVFVYRWLKDRTWVVAPVQNELLLATRSGLKIPPALKADPRLQQLATFAEVLQAVRSWPDPCADGKVVPQPPPPAAVVCRRAARLARWLT